MFYSMFLWVFAFGIIGLIGAILESQGLLRWIFIVALALLIISFVYRLLILFFILFPIVLFAILYLIWNGYDSFTKNRH